MSQLERKRYEAVLFDLFGTLVPDPTQHYWRGGYEPIAAVLGVPFDVFYEVWWELADARMRGVVESTSAQLQLALDRLRHRATAEALAVAASMKAAVIRQTLQPKPDALATLRQLRSAGLAFGLVSDCSFETLDLLDETALGAWFPARASSAVLKTRKPDPLMYEHVVRALETESSRCIYVGDGNSRELEGAKRLGMTTIWVDNGSEQSHRYQFSSHADHAIGKLAELPALIGRLGADVVP